MRASDWISCEDAQPTQSGEYLALCCSGSVLPLAYSARHNAWNAADSRDPIHAIAVDYWMPIVLPEGYGDEE